MPMCVRIQLEGTSTKWTVNIPDENLTLSFRWLLQHMQKKMDEEQVDGELTRFKLEDGTILEHGSWVINIF